MSGWADDGSYDLTGSQFNRWHRYGCGLAGPLCWCRRAEPAEWLRGAGYEVEDNGSYLRLRGSVLGLGTGPLYELISGLEADPKRVAYHDKGMPELRQP